jgi:hypothetical protein
MSVIYMHLDYEAYKGLEEQMRAFKETTHRSTSGFYHKSIRLRIDPTTIVEFHGPLVRGGGDEQ